MWNGRTVWWLRRLGRIPSRLSRELQALWFKRSIGRRTAREVLPRPLSVSISTCTVCNADCTFCGYQYLEKSQKAVMSDEVFARVVEETERLGVKTVSLTPTVGDPLLDKKILARMALLRAHGVEEIGFSTNGIAINRVGAAAIIASGPDSINVSTCGFDAEEYARVYRVRLRDYAKVISGIENLLIENKAQRRGRKITISVISESPAAEVLGRPDARRLLKAGAAIHFTPGIDDWNGQITDDDLGALRNQRRGVVPRRGPCHALYDGLNIYPDGNVNACRCRDIAQNSELHLGNIKTDSLATAHGKTLGIIDRWSAGTVPEFCQTCKVYQEPTLAQVLAMKKGARRPSVGRDLPPLAKAATFGGAVSSDDATPESERAKPPGARNRSLPIVDRG